MKRILMFLMCAALLFSFCAGAEEYTCGDYSYTLNGDGTVCITFWNGTDTELTVPDALDSRAVTAIGDQAFYGTALTSLTLPYGISSIGNSAFAECEYLQSIQLPGALQTLGSFAFYSCESLTEVSVPDGVTELRECTFYHCVNLSRVRLPENLASIGDYAFAACRNLAALSLPDSLETLGGYVFSDCNGLTILATEGSAGARYCATHDISCIYTDAQE